MYQLPQQQRQTHAQTNHITPLRSDIPTVVSMTGDVDELAKMF
jgi:hypothetical protein